MQSNRLKTTLENIPSSVLMIDKQGEIVYCKPCLLRGVQTR